MVSPVSHFNVHSRRGPSWSNRNHECTTTVSQRSRAPAIGIPVRWKILGILSLLGFLSYVFRSNLSVVLPALRTELKLTDADLALVSSAFVWTYTLFQFPGAIWGQRPGSRGMLTLSAVVWAVITALMGLLPWTVLTSTGAILTGLVVLRFLMGQPRARSFPWVLSSSMPGSPSDVGLCLTPCPSWCRTTWVEEPRSFSLIVTALRRRRGAQPSRN